MLYLIKFIYKTFILPPGSIILLLLILSFFGFKKKNKISKYILGIAIILYIFSTYFIADNLIGSLEKKYTPNDNISGDVIIMLGGGATLDTPNINGVGHLYGSASNRVLTVAQLYYKIKVPIIVSGGQVYDFTGNEAEIAKRILTNLNIPEEVIITENKSLNTDENAEFTKELLDKYGFEKPILVTSAFHMHRALIGFQSVGVSLEPFPTDYYTNIKRSYSIYHFIPTADALHESSIALKEFVGILKEKILP
jgi:uncharacterized SAM-binding protein YcdF (DUF218 family)